MSDERVWVNFVLVGEPARVVLEAKRRGIAKSTRDAVVQALVTLNDKMLERDLRGAQVRMQRRAEEELR
ncbi:hypothetical protein MUO93_11935 [Candidatus Bathyarchaeota archaeon]|nr:hypothetical protein [Candidatus Bathyarchaeota archaeon]